MKNYILYAIIYIWSEMNSTQTKENTKEMNKV